MNSSPHQGHGTADRILRVPTLNLQGGQSRSWEDEWAAGNRMAALFCVVTQPGSTRALVLLGRALRLDLQAVPWQAVPLQPLTLGPAAMTASQFKWEQGWL